jgi:hypothetical protein
MTRRHQRPSVKGKGADIFFGDAAPPEQDQDQELESAPATQADADGLDISFEDALARIAPPARITACYRFSQAELDALHSLVQQATEDNRTRISKQDVVRLGLAALLSNYEDQGRRSVLGRFIERERLTTG